MQAYDLIMLIVLAMATIFGAIKGFAWQVASLASIVVSYFVAYRFRYDVADMIQAKPPWNLFLAMLILYVGTSFVIWVAFRLFSNAIDKVKLKEFDRQLGAGFGLAKGLVYCLLITMFAMSLLGANQQQAICESRSGYLISKALDHGMGILPSEIRDVVHPYLAKLDAKLNQRTDGSSDSGAIDNLQEWSQLPSLPISGDQASPGGLPIDPQQLWNQSGFGSNNSDGLAPGNTSLPGGSSSGTGSLLPPIGNTQPTGNYQARDREPFLPR